MMKADTTCRANRHSSRPKNVQVANFAPCRAQKTKSEPYKFPRMKKGSFISCPSSLVASPAWLLRPKHPWQKWHRVSEGCLVFVFSLGDQECHLRSCAYWPLEHQRVHPGHRPPQCHPKNCQLLGPVPWLPHTNTAHRCNGTTPASQQSKKRPYLLRWSLAGS